MEQLRAGPLSVRVRPGGDRRGLLLHGGPGLGSAYLDGLLEEIEDAWTVAVPQQRGVAPSTTDGPFDLDTAVADVIAVLDGLGWPDAVLVGHSYGGLLALALATRHPDRCAAALLVDSIGVVGDGGLAAFETELRSRLTQPALERLAELDELPASSAQLDESLRLLWPAYFADPSGAPASTRCRRARRRTPGSCRRRSRRCRRWRPRCPSWRCRWAPSWGPAARCRARRRRTWSRACRAPG